MKREGKAQTTTLSPHVQGSPSFSSGLFSGLVVGVVGVLNKDEGSEVIVISFRSLGLGKITGLSTPGIA